MVAERGPVPKRSAQRRRTNQSEIPAKKAAGARKVARPRVDPKWHPVAKRWFESLSKSGQSAFYEPSDWATAVVVADAMSRELHPQPMVVGSGKDAHVELVSMPPKGASLAAWLKAMSSLMVTEGDRRRVRLELERPAAEEATAGVSELDDFRRRLSG
jgi:hypothetical protein